MLKQYSLTALQFAINKTLALDEQLTEKLTPLAGKIIQIIIAPLNVSFYIQFMNTHLKLLAKIAQTPDTIIHSSPLGFIRLSLLPASKARSLFNDKIRLSGDTDVGMAVKRLFDEVDIDWEGHLAQFTGDVVAHQIGSLIKKGIHKTKSVNASLNRQMSEYLHEELRVSPTQEELAHFYNDVDTLALDTERLEAQVNHCIKKSHENH